MGITMPIVIGVLLCEISTLAQWPSAQTLIAPIYAGLEGDEYIE